MCSSLSALTQCPGALGPPACWPPAHWIGCHPGAHGLAPAPPSPSPRALMPTCMLRSCALNWLPSGGAWPVMCCSRFKPMQRPSSPLA
eukprot:1157780-Pelagomonas_calceolata.AAC.1